MTALAVSKDGPELLTRRRIHLVKNFTYEYRQPYHRAARLSPDEGRVFITYVERESRALRDLQSELRGQGFSLDRCGLILASGRPLPALPKILAAHSLIHTADGELFREALLHAATRCHLKPLTIKERELIESASRALGTKAGTLTRRLAELGHGLGPPWTQDEKLASLVAWLAGSSRLHSSLADRAREAR
jgi:hypothetical protein